MLKGDGGRGDDEDCKESGHEDRKDGRMEARSVVIMVRMIMMEW